MSAIGRVVRSGVGRRKVSTLVMGLATTMSVTAAIVAGTLIAVSQAPFDHAFTQQNGAQLTVQFDGSKATTAQIAATAHASGVTAAAGPFAETSVDQAVLSQGPNAYGPLGAITVVGRADPGGAVDDVTLTQGTWVTAPGQIVLSAADAPPPPPGAESVLGQALQFPDLPGSPSLTVVGVARSVSVTADAWVMPAEVTSLQAAGATPAYQMLYRFTHAATDTQVAGDGAVIAAAVPHGSVTGTQSYLTVKTGADRSTAPFIPFIVAFGVLGLIMSVLIVSTIVSGAVGAGLRRIGVLKALGFTPAQVVRAYIAQALVPSAVGAVLGVVFGNLLAALMLSNTENVYGTASLSVAAWIDVAVPCAAVAVVAVAALVPALRAGRLSTVEAIAVGRTPRAGRGRFARRALAVLPVPRALSLGLAAPFARPVRALAVAAALVFGATAVTFAVGLASSLHAVQTGLRLDNAADVVVSTDNGGPGGPGGPVNPVNPVNPVGPVSPASPASPASPGIRIGPDGQGTPVAAVAPATVASAIQAQAGTERFYGFGEDQLIVSGVTGAVDVKMFDGDASHAYEMISGHWFTGPGEAVVPTEFLQITGTHLGDTVTIVDGGTSIPVRIVGEAFSTENDGKALLTDASTLPAATADARINQFNITLKPGTDPTNYANALNNALPSGASAMVSGPAQGGKTIVAMDSLITLLTLMLVAVAGLGVLNSVVLDTRERVHDLGVYKAIGMTPRQTTGMVLTSVAGIGLVAGGIGVPLGIALHDYILPTMGHAAGTNLPQAVMDVYSAPELVLLGLGGISIAVLGALAPAGWAAKTRTSTALRTE